MPPNPLKQSGNIINLLGIVVGIVCFLLPLPYATIIGPVIVFICGTLLIWHVTWVAEYTPRRVLFIVLLALICAGLGYIAQPPKPDLVLRLANPNRSTRYTLLWASLYNQSDVLADKLGYEFELINVNQYERARASLPREQRLFPSPSSPEIQRMTASSFVRVDSFRVPDQFVKAKSAIELTAINATDEFFNAQQIGDKLIGAANISCANCPRERGYWIFYEVGKGGWFAETADGSKPSLSRILTEEERRKLMTQPESYLDTKRLIARTPI